VTAHSSARLLPRLLLPALLAVLAVLAAVPAQASEHRKGGSQAATAAVPVKRRTKAARPATPEKLVLKSSSALVVDQVSGELLVAKNADAVVPIASLTKLMTGLVVLDAGLPMGEELEISGDDIDREKNTHSRLAVGTRLKRDDMMLLALMSSDNRAAMSLSRNFPGGRPAFLERMNAKARALGMSASHFADPAGLSIRSVSTARDLHRLVTAAYARPEIRRYSTTVSTVVKVKRSLLTFKNSNRLIGKDNDWHIELQKTGFTNEAGRCLVMDTRLKQRRLAMIFLDSDGIMTRYADANRVRKWLERNPTASASTTATTGPAAVTAAAGSS